jgi:parallel beta-helix repeat protein
MKNKTLILMIFSISILSILIPNTKGYNIFSNNILYVDDDNVEGPWDGSVEHPFKNIYDAVIIAVDYDTIYVKNGIYYENIIINRSLNLIGEDRNLTIIDGGENGTIIHAFADRVVISDFTIKNGRDAIIIWSDNCIILNNKISDNYNGIGLSSSNSTIKNNIIKNNYHNGINCYDLLNSTIIHNTILNNHYGVSLGQESLNNNIEDNIIVNQSYYGISISGKNNTISQNTITRNDCGFGFFTGRKNRVIENNFLENRIHARFFNSGDLFCRNFWFGNYWDNWKLFIPKPIPGLYVLFYETMKIPLINFDWHPALEPYNK